MSLGIPSKITAGDSITWISDLLPSYHPSNFSLTWSIRGDSSLDLTATAEADRYLTTITGEQSATLNPGQYFYQCYVTDAQERITIGDGQIWVLPNLFSLTGSYDGRSKSQQMLDAVQDAIQKILNNGAVKDYRIKEREMTHTDLAELYKLENNLRIRVAREQGVNQGLSNKLHIRFW